MDEIQEEITRKVTNLFGSKAAQDEGMWDTFSQFAAQFDELQILGITYLTYIAKVVAPDPLAGQIDAFIKEYKTLCNNRGTLMAVLRMGEVSALKDYFRGVEGRVQITK